MHMCFLPAALLATACGGTAHAVVLLDDFSSGSASAVVSAGPDTNPGTTLQQQAGTMAGGLRTWWLGLYGDETLHGAIDITPAGFDLRTDSGAAHRLELFYGSSAASPMSLDLSGDDRLRLSFADAPRGLSLNVFVHFGPAPGASAWIGVNAAPKDGAFDLTSSSRR